MAAWKGGKDTLPPVWVDKIEVVEEETKKIQILMRELHTLHNKRLTVSFDMNEEDQEREINQKTLEITDVFRKAEGYLKKFGNQGDEREISASERTVRRNIQSSNARELQELSLKFRSTQKQYMERVKAQKSGSGDAGFDYLNAPEPQRSELDIDLGFTTAQMVVVEEAEDLVNARDEEIQQIAKSIEELAQIFKELAVLVIDQGTILDRIDFNMENAVEHAKEGVVQLEKAEEHQKNATGFKCICLLVVLIIIMLGVLIWKHTDGPSANKDDQKSDSSS
jgi:syntaxin 16